MIYIEAKELAKSYGIKELFEGITFNLCEGDKIALVAANGSGKSTLMKILMQKEMPDKGKIIINKEVKVLYLEQETYFDNNLTVEDFLLDFIHPRLQAFKLYQKALEDTSFMEEALHDMEKYDAWNLEEQLNQIISQLQLPPLNAKMQHLSGGQLKRLGLAKLLMNIALEEGHFLLLLDEPTNHLDPQMVEWLETYLNKKRLTLLVITHDRIFLDQVCNTIWEIDQGELHLHKGDYAQYLMNKAIREENLLSTIDKAQNLYRKELDWMRRQPKARTTKSKSRIDAFFNTEATAKQTIDTKKVMLDMQMTRLGGKVLEMQKVDKSFGEKLTILDQYSYVFQRGDKIGIIGKNGVGKTTFLNILQGLETIDSGKREVGETIVFGYYTQKGLVLPKEDKRVIEYVKDIAEFFPLSNGKELSASQFLKRFLFNDDLQYQYISKLSGGEKKRLHLLSELFKNPNFLILDEPTNDLDLPTLTILEDFLINYKGCLIIISHDRYFMNRVVNHLFVFKGNGVIVDFIGTYNKYIDSEKTPTIENNNNTIKPIKKEEIVVLKTQKISYKQKQEKEKIETTIPLLQEKIENITKQLEVEKNFEVIKNLGEEISQINKEIEALEIKWLELSELAE